MRRSFDLHKRPALQREHGKKQSSQYLGRLHLGLGQRTFMKLRDLSSALADLKPFCCAFFSAYTRTAPLTML